MDGKSVEATPSLYTPVMMFSIEYLTKEELGLQNILHSYISVFDVWVVKEFVKVTFVAVPIASL